MRSIYFVNCNRIGTINVTQQSILLEYWRNELKIVKIIHKQNKKEGKHLDGIRHVFIPLLLRARRRERE